MNSPKYININHGHSWLMDPDDHGSIPAALIPEETILIPFSTGHIVTREELVPVDDGTPSSLNGTHKLSKSQEGSAPSTQSVSLTPSPVSSMLIENNLNGVEKPPKINQNTPERSSEGQNDRITVVGREIVEASDQARHNRKRRKYEKLRRLRSRNLFTRSSAYSQRVGLGEARLALVSNEKVYMKLLRDSQYADTSGKDGSSLEETFQKLEASIQEYDRLEEKYNTIEDRLDREESELINLEERISQHTTASASSDSTSQASGNSTSSNLSSNQAVARNNPFRAYMSRLGDAENIRESRAELLQENTRLSESFNTRQRLGLQLAAEDLTILEEFPREKARLEEQFAEVAADVKRLRYLCIQEGLIDPNISDEPSEIGIELDINIATTHSEEFHEPFPKNLSPFALLLAQQDATVEGPILLPPSSALSEFPERTTRLQPVVSTNHKENNRNAVVTQWLFQKLRSSPGEIEILRRFSNSLGPALPEKEWQQRVLRYWYLDGAGTRTFMTPPLEPKISTALLAPENQNVDLIEREGGKHVNRADNLAPQEDTDRGRQVADEEDPPSPPLPFPLFNQATFEEKVVDSTTIGIKLDYGLLLQRMRSEPGRAMSV